ncbi:MAG: hypothetical protein WDZ59_05145 [Pirellulales bacterium]
MLARILPIALFSLVAVATFSLHAPGATAQERDDGWRAPGQSGASSSSAGAAPAPESASPAPQEKPLERVGNGSQPAPISRVTKGSGTLPNDHGQVWREYDISPYTLRVTTTNRPEQAIVDWILRETGYEAWHSEPLGMLSATQRILRVYHTPEMQAIVAESVDRFVNSQAATHAFGLRIVTLESPNWRAKAMRLMTPVQVQSPGVQGWLLAKEDAALLMAELSRRTDYREHSSPHLLVNNGQSTIVSSMRPRTYVKGILHRQDVWPGYEPEMGQIEEGFTLQFNPLLSLDGRSVDAVIKLQLNQLEKMVPVTLEVPTPIAPRQRTQIDVPQMTARNLHERFRWPVDKVLLLSMGVVATPGPARPSLIDALPLPDSPPRADALLFVESKGDVLPPGAPAATASRPSTNYSGRY